MPDTPDDRARRATDHREPYAPDDSTGPGAIVRHDREPEEEPRWRCGWWIAPGFAVGVAMWGALAWLIWRAM